MTTAGHLVSTLLLDPRSIEPRWWPLAAAGAESGLVERLLETERSRARMAARLYTLVGVRPLVLAPGEPAARLLALGEADWRQLLERLGLVWNGRTVVRIVHKHLLERLLARVGGAAYRRALASRPLWAAAAGDDNPERVIDRLFDDGVRCIQAWLATESDGIARHIALRLPPQPVLATALPAEAARLARAIVEQELAANGELRPDE